MANMDVIVIYNSANVMRTPSRVDVWEDQHVNLGLVTVPVKGKKRGHLVVETYAVVN